jgi:Ca2+-binding EF-hand superfamily protein
VEELTVFFASVANLAGSCANIFVNVVGTTVQEGVSQNIASAMFGALDENEDGSLDEQELVQVKEMAVGVLTELTEHMVELKDADPEDPSKVFLDVIVNIVKACSEAGDLSRDGLFELCRDHSLENLRTIRHFAEKMVPIPKEVMAPFLDSTLNTYEATSNSSMKSVTDAYFDLLDSDGDGTLQNAELMAVPNCFSTDESINAEDKYQRLFRMIDTDGDGCISNDEFIAHLSKIFDIMMATAKFGVLTYQEVAKAVASAFFKLYVGKVAEDGEKLTQEQCLALFDGFHDNGPEALLMPLMESAE